MFCALALTACGGGGDTSPAPQAGFTNTFNIDSPLGTNLAWVKDFTSEYPFANFFKQARFWTSSNSLTGVLDDGRTFNLDADGYITSLQSDQIGIALLFTGVPRDVALNGRRFVLRFDGDGDISFQAGASIISQAAGRQVIQLDIGGASGEAIVAMKLTRTDASNYVRNIRLTPEGGICRSNPLAAATGAAACARADFVSFEDAATAGEILFNPEFLDSIKTYRSVRFMDWLRTNNSTLVSFADRPKVADAFWSTTAGVPLEAIVALANLMDFDPWITFPHLVDDNYVTQTATLLRDQLETARRAYIEYSNETWNGIFAQAVFVQDQGEARGLNQPGNDRFVGGLRFYSLRAQEISDIFQTVYGASRASRIVRVMATQAGSLFATQKILEFTNAATKCDRFAIAPYFGSTIGDVTRADLFKAAGVDGVFDWLTTGTPDLGRGKLADLDQAVQDQKATVDTFNIPLITYEGGQHLVTAGAVQDDPVLNQIMDDVNRDARMKTVYLTYLNNWRARSNEVFWHYLNTDRWSKFGRWGSREFSTQPRAQAPKFDALQTYIENQPLR